MMLLISYFVAMFLPPWEVVFSLELLSPSLVELWFLLLQSHKYFQYSTLGKMILSPKTYRLKVVIIECTWA